jgi:nicotinamide-nucleotide amidase
LMTEAKNPTVAPYCKEGEVRLRVTAESDCEASASALCDGMISDIRATEVGRYIYGVDVASLENAVVLFLRERGLTLATAESCTGGLIAKRITDLSGCSDVFSGGCVTYSNEAKERLLGVSHESLACYGAVSEQVAAEMARGVRERLGADVGISATGIAGPTGGNAEKPVGTVYVGISTKNGEQVRKLSLSPMRSRDYIRKVTASNAYDMILKSED